MNFSHEPTRQFIDKLASYDSDSGAKRRAAARLRRALSRPLRLGLFGDTGAGKSQLLNVLLRANVFPAGVLGGVRPLTLVRRGQSDAMFSIRAGGARHRLTTKAVQQATRGEHREGFNEPQVIYKARAVPGQNDLQSYSRPAAVGGAPIDFLELQFDLPVLQHLDILEVPGSFRDHAPTAPSLKALRRVDLAIWITSASQAWKKSEVTAWDGVRPVAAERSLLVVTRKEALASDEDGLKLSARLAEETTAYFSGRVLVSLKQAALALPAATIDEKLLKDAGISELEEKLEAMVANIKAERLAKAERLFFTKIDADNGVRSPEVIYSSLAAPRAGARF